MLKPQSLPAKSIEILLARLKNEQEAFYFYVSAMAWCRLNSYECCSRYFEVESYGEQWHYKKILNFLADWNTAAYYSPLPEQIKPFVSLQDIFEQAYKLELKLGEQYEDDAKAIFPISQNTYAFIQTFVEIQNDSVISSNNYLQKLYKYLETDPGLMLFDTEVFSQFNNLAY